jgi:S-adenosylmethionine hydrolase
MSQTRSGIITLTTDFGLADGYVGQMVGAILSVDPALRVVDVSHAVPPQAIAVGGLLLAAAASAFPAGTVHVLVVDPGVGTTRAGLLAAVGRAWFVGPDNGGWSALVRAAEARGEPVRAWRLTEPRFWRTSVSATFHGRDVFAPAAAHLAGGVAPDALGQPFPDPVRLPAPLPAPTAGGVTGRIVHIDHFGNAITDLTRGDLPDPPAALHVRCGRFAVAGIARTYADVTPGAPVALVGSFGTLELAERDGSAAATFDLARDDQVAISTR